MLFPSKASIDKTGNIATINKIIRIVLNLEFFTSIIDKKEQKAKPIQA